MSNSKTIRSFRASGMKPVEPSDQASTSYPSNDNTNPLASIPVQSGGERCVIPSTRQSFAAVDLGPVSRKAK
jgi:hypothetical protein